MGRRVFSITSSVSSCQTGAKPSSASLLVSAAPCPLHDYCDTCVSSSRSLTLVIRPSSRGATRRTCTTRGVPTVRDSHHLFPFNSRGRRYSWGNDILLALALINFLMTKSAWSQSCVDPPHTATISETDPPGTIAFNVSAESGVLWRYTLGGYQAQLSEYLDFAKNPTDPVYSMKINQTLDIDQQEIFDKFGSQNAAIELTLLCQVAGQSEVPFYPVLIVSTVNEHAPEFNTTSIVQSVKESIPVNSYVVQLLDWAFDRDRNIGSREITAFLLGPSSVDAENDGLLWLEIADAVNGTVRVANALDYESLPSNRKFIVVGVIVRDSSGLTGSSTFTLNVEDADDLNPEFFYPGCPIPCLPKYSVRINPNITGTITDMEPALIQARDGDSLGYDVTYHINSGPTNYEQYISMDSATGLITIIKELGTVGIADLVFIIEAREVSVSSRFTTTSLLVSLDGAGTGAGGGGIYTAASTGSDDILIVAIVLAIVIFIVVVILIVGTIYFRKKYKKAIHPHPPPPDENPQTGEPANTGLSNGRPRPLRLSDEEAMRAEEEMTTWVPVMPSKDIVDLSDEDTIKWNKTNGAPPTDTKLCNRDSAFEESDKKSVSDDSNGNIYNETVYAEVDSPPPKLKGTQGTQPFSGHVYGNVTEGESLPSATSTTEPSAQDGSAEDHEYATPLGVGLKAPFSAAYYNKTFRNDSDISRDSKASDPVKKTRKKIKEKRNKADGQNVPASDDNATHKASVSFPHEAAEDNVTRMTKYHPTPSASSRANYAGRPLPIPEDEEECRLKDIHSADSDGLKASPRPRLRAVSGLTIEGDTESPYATVGKKGVQKIHSSDADHSTNDSSAENSPATVVAPLQPPARRKRPRRRSKASRSPEEDVYDGTKDYEDLEVDSGFYTDSTKSRIKRSTRVPVMKPDPNDTRYWITVTNDY